MNRKDIYEHLANIYLDASAKKKNKKAQKHPDIFQKLFFLNSVVILLLIVVLVNVSQKEGLKFTDLKENRPINSELALVLQSNIIKINFNFDPVKEESYHINLNELDLSRFKELGFSVRKADYEDKIVLKVQFTNASREKSEIYFYNIPSYKWQEHKINFSQFKNIADWSKMSTLSFIVEEWNVKEKQGIVYIDSVRFLR